MVGQQPLPGGHRALVAVAQAGVAGDDDEVGAAVVEVPPMRVEAGTPVDVPFDPIDPRPAAEPDPASGG